MKTLTKILSLTLIALLILSSVSFLSFAQGNDKEKENNGKAQNQEEKKDNKSDDQPSEDAEPKGKDNDKPEYGGNTDYEDGELVEKVEWTSGGYKTETGDGITLTGSTATEVTWESEEPITAIVIKGATGSYTLILDEAATKGSFSNNLLPDNGGDNTPNISNIKFYAAKSSNNSGTVTPPQVQDPPVNSDPVQNPPQEQNPPQNGSSNQQPPQGSNPPQINTPDEDAAETQNPPQVIEPSPSENAQENPNNSTEIGSDTGAPAAAPVAVENNGNSGQQRSEITTQGTTNIQQDNLALSAPVVANTTAENNTDDTGVDIAETLIPQNVPTSLPKTGELPSALFFSFGGIVSSLGLFLKRKF